VVSAVVIYLFINRPRENTVGCITWKYISTVWTKWK